MIIEKSQKEVNRIVRYTSLCRQAQEVYKLNVTSRFVIKSEFKNQHFQEKLFVLNKITLISLYWRKQIVCKIGKSISCELWKRCLYRFGDIATFLYRISQCYCQMTNNSEPVLLTKRLCEGQINLLAAGFWTFCHTILAD